MKTIPGKIIIGIDNKVYFEPDELPKPSKAIYNRAKLYHFENLIIQKYEASKQLVEVKNAEAVYEWFDEIDNPNDDKIYGYSLDLYEPTEIGNTAIMIKNNQICKAEIKDNKATIIELL